jgi:hypothetical protein
MPAPSTTPVKTKSEKNTDEHFRVSNLVWFLNFHQKDEPAEWVHQEYMKKLQASNDEIQLPIRYTRFNDASHVKWMLNMRTASISWLLDDETLEMTCLRELDKRLFTANVADFPFVLNDEFGY